MAERIVVFRDRDPLSFVADCCGALADAVNGIHSWGPRHDETVAVYASMVRAYAGLIRPRIESQARLRIIDHLIDRLSQSERGEIMIPVAEIVDRLHGELVSQLVLH